MTSLNPGTLAPSSLEQKQHCAAAEEASTVVLIKAADGMPLGQELPYKSSVFQLWQCV